MTRPFQIEGGQKQFFSGSTDNVVQSWLYIESKLQAGFKFISARNLSAKLSELGEIFDNYRAIGWEVEVGKNFVRFETKELPIVKIGYETDLINLPENLLKPLTQHEVVEFNYSGDLQSVFVFESYKKFPNISMFLKKTGASGKLRIQHFSNDIQPWWKFVTQIIYRHDFLLVYKL